MTVIFKDMRVYQGLDHYLVKATTRWNWLKDQSNTHTEQIYVKYCYPLFKMELLQEESIKDLYEKIMSEKLNAELKGMAKGIYNHLKLNVSAAALEDLGTKNRKEGNRKD